MWEKPDLVHGVLTKWLWVAWYPEHLLIMENTDIGAFTYIQAEFGVSIGTNVQIGAHCAIYSRSTIDDKSGKVTICRDAKIGSHCTIMPGVTIGEGAIVGAHSFVNCDVPAGETWFGVPASWRVAKGA